MSFTSNSILRAVRTHIAKSPACLAACMGVKEIELETLRSEAMVGGAGAAGPDPKLRQQQAATARSSIFS